MVDTGFPRHDHLLFGYNQEAFGPVQRTCHKMQFYQHYLMSLIAVEIDLHSLHGKRFHVLQASSVTVLITFNM